ncbi:MAG: thiamine pyrophosphate-dependent dehydrogenase E1 component subunit alpha [Clostridia bacterium]|nr:thiamine pyrophosphate-dependent dehydrogenase E1 component subunit alpha [Clostridia bacterium]
MQRSEMLKRMMTIREFERIIKDLARTKIVDGAIHCYTGEEAVAVGVCAALTGRDYVFSTHRGHGHAIARGLPLDNIMAELMGKAAGVSGGYGGSMHLFSREYRLMGGNGIVGGGITLALGPAYAAKLQGTDEVTVTFFSEGASNEGWCHEAMNMASLWKLPLIFACENNCFAATTPSFKTLSDMDLAKRAGGYAMAGEIVDGNDVEAVYEAASRAVEKARAGEGPTFLEFKTYRVEGHCMVLRDLEQFRPREEVLKWAARDPITVLRERMIAEGILTEAGFEALRDEVAGDFERALAFGRESALPSIEAFGERIRKRYAI